jgi:hypothetical protein
MYKVGIIGKGYFGKKIHSTLQSFCDIKFFTGREFDVTYDIDWVVIASSTESHYELAKHFIESGVNVFVEKPMTPTYQQSKELVDLSKKHNVKLYVDDVFLYHPTLRWITQYDPKVLRFEWKKYGSFNDNIFNNLSYHDLYIALHLGHELSGDIHIKTNRVNEKEFTIGDIEFYYDRLSSVKTKQAIGGGYTFDFKTNLNLLTSMFHQVFDGKVSFESNNQMALEINSILDRLNEYKPKVAVVGAGIFGVTSALKLDGDFDVTLFEKNNDILQNASSINQYRLHRGYHYPRSIETAVSAKHGTQTFLKEYPCELESPNQYYAIASFGSKVTSDDYESFMNSVGLDYEEVESDLLVDTSIEKLYKVNEGLFDPCKLYDLCNKKLNNSEIIRLTNCEFTKDSESEFDYIVNAAYANVNQISDNKRKYQFELCEKPLIKLPDEYKGVGIIIMDGPFTCIDPYSDTDYHIVGNVVHAIHHSNVGEYPEIPMKLKGLLNKGVIKNPKITKWSKFKDTLSQFFTNIDEVEHIGSMYTIRTVLSNRDYDDARPSIVDKESKSKYLIFSGKISTAVDAADELHNYIMKS